MTFPLVNFQYEIRLKHKQFEAAVAATAERIKDYPIERLNKIIKNNEDHIREDPKFKNEQAHEIIAACKKVLNKKNIL